MSAFCLYNALYLGSLVDILIEEQEGKGIIADFGPNLHEKAKKEGFDCIDAKGLVLFPSFIDCHTHLRDPGYVWKEDIASGLAAAAHGGFGAVLCMANTNPINDDPAVTRAILEKARLAYPHGPKVYPIGALTKGLCGKELAPMADLAQAGCVAFSNDGLPVASAEIFRRAMEYADDLGLVIIDHCEDPSLAKGSHMHEGYMSGLLGIKGQLDVAETIQASRDMWLSECLNIPVHIAHVSAKRTVDAIAFAKSRGVKVSAETCPHYLALTEHEVNNYNLLAKVNPPLRTEEDKQALREAVKSGIIDILATDHAPHAAHEKDVAFDDAPNGFTGLDLALSVTYELVREAVLSEEDLIRLWSHKPAALFNLPVNRFEKGDSADFFLFDPSIEWEVCPENLHSKSHNTPWLNQKVKGRVVKHWLEGKEIV